MIKLSPPPMYIYIYVYMYIYIYMIIIDYIIIYAFKFNILDHIYMVTPPTPSSMYLEDTYSDILRLCDLKT